MNPRRGAEGDLCSKVSPFPQPPEARPSLLPSGLCLSGMRFTVRSASSFHRMKKLAAWPVAGSCSAFAWVVSYPLNVSWRWEHVGWELEGRLLLEHGCVLSLKIIVLLQVVWTALPVLLWSSVCLSVKTDIRLGSFHNFKSLWTISPGLRDQDSNSGWTKEMLAKICIGKTEVAQKWYQLDVDYSICH